MTDHQGFYTLKGYSLLENNTITPSMEDYLEMIYRIHQKEEPVRIRTLSDLLHVKPSSATKMVANLKKQSLVLSEKYGCITPTNLGLELGRYLVFRHNTLHRLLCRINHSDNELEQVEKIEHFISARTIENISKFLDQS